MIYTSKAYKEAIHGQREFCVMDKITFSDGTQLQLSMEDIISYSINDATSESGKFQVGAAIIKQYSIVLSNIEGTFDGYSFEGATITADIGLKLADGTWEILRKGTFSVVKAKETERSISITAYDGMLFFDTPYRESGLEYPTTITEIIQNACTCCQMTFDASTVQMGNYVVQSRPADDALTFRDVISYAAQIMGCYARVGRLGELCFGWYSFDNDALFFGGIFDKDTPYSTGDDLDGGSFKPWNNGDTHSADFSSMSEYHHFYDLKTKSDNIDDIVITGVQVYPKVQGNAAAASFGEDGYMIVIENNPLIQSESDAAAVAQHVGQKLRYNCFRPMSITVQSDPSVEAGDPAIVTYDVLKPAFYTVITNTTFSIGGAQKVECTAETPTEKTYKRFSAQTRILAKAKEDAQEQMSVYEIAIQQMNQLAANTMGFFATSEKQEDGSIIAYRHDKPEIAESTIIYKSGIDGFWVSQDGGKTWAAGFDSNGNAVLNVLSVIGINFDWARGGTLTLGGVGNGLLRIRNASGAQIGYIDNTGVHFNQGVFSGTVNAGTIIGASIIGNSTIRGADIFGGEFITIETDDDEASLGIRITQSEQSLYEESKICFYSYEPNWISLSKYAEIGLVLGRDDYFDPDNEDDIWTERYCPYIKTFGRGLLIDKLEVTGTKKRIVATDNYGVRSQYCYEMATPYFGDVGTARTDENGNCFVSIDDIFAETISSSVEYSVFLQKEGEGDIWVSEKHPEYFIVKGTENLSFSWEIKAVQRDYEYYRLEDTGDNETVALEDDELQQIFSKELERYDAEMEGIFNEDFKSFADN